MIVAINKAIAAKCSPHRFQGRRPRAFVDGDAYTIASDFSKVDAIVHGVFS